jgi:hypothetical protein
VSQPIEPPIDYRRFVPAEAELLAEFLTAEDWPYFASGAPPTFPRPAPRPGLLERRWRPVMLDRAEQADRKPIPRPRGAAPQAHTDKWRVRLMLAGLA